MIAVEGVTVPLNSITNTHTAQTIELGHATDTTLSRSASGVLAVEGKDVYMAGGADVAVADGGTGLSTLTANNVILGNGTSAVQFVAPGTNGNVLTSNGTTWTSAAPSSAGIIAAGIFENAQTISTNYAITAGKNGLSAGPITVGSGVVVTVPSGSRWVVV